ncbi:hydroxyacid oxidase 2 isoform X1 [Vombatus ursinus]|uniref:(S)-2-hydroxy-acid oxidase n=2 Tax=Vombatus ursinus TaxID=29139 RepID=A0A4X2KFC5_VOMUR|nr:hydroxyacid oxidase 2 isoform X1 [Vombatus ursinus]XP_027722523.1 hydroxyacid oxidase 2 isoform X1 [Vombatus ursinus]XP_027722524.1 hydroxyacid oxidase 2 isoform X1 [Vombatus ursinus]
MAFVCLADFQAFAKDNLPKSTWEFIEGGADECITRDENISAYKKIRLRPRFLRDMSVVDTKTTIQGSEISFPVCIAPTGFHCLCWPDGEQSTAKAAEAMNICYVTSTYSSCFYDDIVAGAPNGLRWIQLYVQRDRKITKKLIQKVESLGYKALVLTVDTPALGNRLQDNRNRFSFPALLSTKNIHVPIEENSESLLSVSSIDSSTSWKDIAWLKSITQMPIILKGILTREDAELAISHNVQGILVSNHGGRQLDTVPATIDALTEVVNAVQGRIEVYLDGGIRTGTDVLKALALGARCVFLGRPILWGLTYKGEEGVRQVLNLLKKEFYRSMVFTGCRSISEISQDLVQFSKL